MTPPSASGAAASAITVISGRGRRSCRSARPGVSPGPREADVRAPPCTLPASKTCSGRPKVEGHVVGDVDQRRDRPQPDGEQAVAAATRGSGRCAGRGSAADEVGAGVRRVGGEREPHADRAGEARRRRGSTASGFSGRMPAAARSRAMPRTPRQSPRLGVMATSITGSSSPMTRRARAPTGRVVGSSMMPACSSESPSRARRAACRCSRRRGWRPGFRSGRCPGCGAGGAKTPFMPVRALGAPQTTCTARPVSTVQTLSLSALGWGGRDDAGDGEAFSFRRRGRRRPPARGRSWSARRRSRRRSRRSPGDPAASRG
jgi:hypothetical protein